MPWTNEVVLEFLNLYKSEQLLWDPKHPLHRNRSEVTDAWLRIESSLSINNNSLSIIDLKKKKESLMTSFRMHWNKKRTQEGYRTTWFAYPLMESFLGGKYECDSTNQIENEYFTNSITYQTIPEPIVVQKPLEKTNYIGRQNRVSQNSYKAHSNESDLVHPKTHDDVTHFKSVSGEKRDIDEYELYGQLLAKKLRKLDEHQRDVAMHEIDNIMFRAKMQSSASQLRSYSASPPPVSRKNKSPIFIVAQQDHSHCEDNNITFQEQSIQPQQLV